MCDKAKLRISVTMTRTYVDALDSLVEQGLYMSRGDAILEAIRIFLRDRGVKPFDEKKNPE